MHSIVKGYIDNFVDYFPDNEESWIPSWKYFWNTLSILNYEIVEGFIDRSIKKRNKHRITQKVG